MNNPNLIKIFIYCLLLFPFIIISCNIQGTNTSDREVKELTKSNLKSLSEHTSKVAFVKANEEYYSSSNAKSCFGDIYIYDFFNSSLYKMTDNCYYEADLCWSEDGSKLLFASNRDKVYKYPEPDWWSNPDLYILDLPANTINRINNFSSDLYNTGYLTGLCWLKAGIVLGNSKRIFLIGDNGNYIKDLLDAKDSIYIYNFRFTPDEKYLILHYSSSINNTYTEVGFLNIESNKFHKINGDYAIKGSGFKNNSFLFGNRDSLFLYNIDILRYNLVNLSGLGDTLTIVSAFYLSSTELLFNSVRSPFVNGKLNRKIKLTGYLGFYNLENKTVEFLTQDSRSKSDLALYNNKRE